MTLKGVWSLWDQFWFQPASPSPVCIYRILLGILLLINGCTMGPDLFTFFGQHSLMPISTAKDWQHTGEFAKFSVLLSLPSTDSVAIGIYVVYMISAACLTLGLFSRLSAAIVFACLVSLQHRTPCIFNGGDTVVRIHTFLLCFAPAGLLYSIDSLRKKKVETLTLASPWAQRLIQLHISAVYWQTFWAKMDCRSWLDGNAVYYTTRLTEFSKFPVPYLFDHLWTLKLLNYGTLSIEFALCSLIWIRDFRYIVLVLGVLLHLGIEWSMNLALFEWIMIASFVNFVYPEDLNRFLGRVKAVLTRQPVTKLTECEPVQNPTNPG